MPPPAKLKPHFPVVFQALALVAIVGAIAIYATSDYETGLPLYSEAPAPNHVLETLQVALAAQNGLTELVLATFGAVAFLLSFHQKRSQALPQSAAGFLAVTLILLTGALALSLLAHEMLLWMLGSGAVDLGAAALVWARRGVYGFLGLAAVALGTFFLLMLAAPSDGGAQPTAAQPGDPS